MLLHAPRHLVRYICRGVILWQRSHKAESFAARNIARIQGAAQKCGRTLGHQPRVRITSDNVYGGITR